jgi:cytochrome c oxidase assembly protein subunit 15
MLGGYTRLSEAGLSIVEWKPFTGIFPPNNEKEWIEAFNSYSQFPEYKEKNFDITLSQFKNIYWTEYMHRLLGRITGIVFLLPFVYFIYKKWLTQKQILTFIFIFFLGGVQGFLGWYMVRSGLKFDPDISHYRLTIHLLMAVLIYGLIIWNFMNFCRSETNRVHHSNITVVAFITMFICILQIGLGAMVAGLNAGLIYNTFPLMDGYILPNDVATGIMNFDVLYNPSVMQFLHRIVASILLVLSVFLFIYSEVQTTMRKIIKFAIRVLCIIILIQVALGISTLVYKVPLNLAFLHQFIAIIVFTNLLFIIHHLVYEPYMIVKNNL